MRIESKTKMYWNDNDQPCLGISGQKDKIDYGQDKMSNK